MTVAIRRGGMCERRVGGVVWAAVCMIALLLSYFLIIDQYDADGTALCESDQLDDFIGQLWIEAVKDVVLFKCVFQLVLNVCLIANLLVMKRMCIKTDEIIISKIVGILFESTSFGFYKLITCLYCGYCYRIGSEWQICEWCHMQHFYLAFRILLILLDYSHKHHAVNGKLFFPFTAWCFLQNKVLFLFK